METSKITNTWIKCYSVILPNKKAIQNRLNELKTWDTNGNDSLEHHCKIEALNYLLSI